MRPYLLRLTPILLVLMLVACGGGGGTDTGGAVSNSAPENAPAEVQTATIGIVITDKPSSEYDEAIATITSIELIGAKGKQEIFSGSVVLDLFKLRDFVELVTIADRVQPDTIEKIRLRLTSLTLIKRDDNGGVDKQVEAKLAGNGKIDLKPAEPIDIEPGVVLFLTFDFDVDKSFKLTEAGKDGEKAIVRPIIFVRVGAVPGFKDGITRVAGEIESINDTAEAFLLCMTDVIVTPVSSKNHGVSERCIKVSLDDDTGVFDSNGLPLDPMKLAAGDPVTVVGKLGLPDDDPVIIPLSASAKDDSDSDSNGDSDSRADSDSDSDGGGSRPPLQFLLNAIVIERGAPGTFASIRGELTSGVDDLDQYSILVAGEQGFAPDTMLLGQLYEKSRIFNFAGQELERSVLAAEDGVLANGVILITNAEGESDTLRTSLILVRRSAGPDPEPEEEVLIGKLLSVDADTEELMVATGKGDRCVLAGEAEVLFVVDADGGLDIVTGEIMDLQDGATLVLFGAEGACFDANTIISRLPPKIEPVTVE